MFQALFDFFYNLFQLTMDYSGIDLNEGIVSVNTGSRFFNDEIIPNFFEMTLPEYLSLICSLISLIFIVVLCCLFIYKIIKLVGGLIR